MRWRMGKSRSQLYAEAVAEYLTRHAPDAVTEAMNAVCAAVGDEKDGFGKAAAKRLLRKEKW